MRLDLAPVAGGSNTGLEQHDTVAQNDGAEQINQRHRWCLPERVDLSAHHHQHGTERGLVHHRQHHAQRDKEEQHFGQFFLGIAKAELFQEDRRELDPHDHDVRRDADRYFEHDGVRIGITGPEDVPEVPPATEVKKDAAAGQRVAKQAGQQGRADQWVVLALVEDVDQQRDREAAAGQSRADHDIDHDPDAPGVAVVDVGDGSQTKDKAHQENGRHDGDEHAADQSGGVNQAAANWRRTCVLMLCHAHFSPVPLPSESSSSWTFFLAMKLKAPSTAIGMISPPYKEC